MTLYIDSFFFINFLFDFLILFITAYLGGIKICFGRLILSSVIGSIASCMAVLFGFVTSFFLKAVVIALMSLVAFGFSSFKIYLRQSVLLFTGFFIQGGAAGLLSLYGKGDVYSGIYHVDFPLIGFLFLIVMGLSATFIISAGIKERRGKIFAAVEIYKNGERFKLKALYDSGNLCTDVLTNLPVIVAENIFPGVQTRENVFTTASGIGEMGIFYPDYVRVNIKGETYEGKDIAIGVVNERLSSDRRFNALIGGICFDRLIKEINSSSGCIKGRRRSLLHRDGTSAPTAPGHTRGGKTFKGA